MQARAAAAAHAAAVAAAATPQSLELGLEHYTTALPGSYAWDAALAQESRAAHHHHPAFG